MSQQFPWHLLTPPEFEQLALKHVGDIYPDFTWRSTPLVSDGGKDAIGELHNLSNEITEIYWMEAKHHPKDHSIGKYTLDTHLVSAFFSSEVKRLHVVTSGSFSANFLHRADMFSKEHGFVFAYSECNSVLAWLASRRDLVNQYFYSHTSDVLDVLEQSEATKQSVFARALVVADNDSLTPSSIPVTRLLPGKKFRLVVSISVAAKFPLKSTPLQLHWTVSPKRVSFLSPSDAETKAILKFDPIKEPIVTIPFRLLGFSSQALPKVSIHAADGTVLSDLRLSTSDMPRLTSPFVGQIARDELLTSQKILRHEVAMGRPKLVICRGRAGSGKTRLAEELRDDSQRFGFTARLVQIPATPQSQEDRWSFFFRWLFGLEHNPFDLPEEEVIRKRLTRLNLGQDDHGRFQETLKSFLIEGTYSEDLFNLDLAEGRIMARAVREAFSNRWDRHFLLHIDDAHHLSRRQLRPLYLLRHVIETSDSLPLCLIITARNDETVRDNSFEYFVNSLELAESSALHLIDLPELTPDDAKELVVMTLRWPELLAKESKTLALIIERAGTNPFVLMQVLNHLAIDHETVEFGHGDGHFLIDIPGFKRALRTMPTGVGEILSSRFNGLVSRGENRLLLALAAAAIIGRRVSRRVVNRALPSRLTSREVNRLLELGYLADASMRHIELTHDLLVEALRKRPEAKKVAARLASSVAPNNVLTSDQLAAVYFAAGRKYYRKSWDTTRHIVERRFQGQEYLNLPPLLERLKHISTVVRSLKFDVGLKWFAAIAEQHSGNTYRALEEFLEIKEAAEETLPETADLYIDATIEAGNQYILRAEPTSAVLSINDALTMLNDPNLQVSSQRRSRLTALAHNRCGAALHLIERREKAIEHFDAALTAAAAAEDNYLISHTYWNMAALLRFDEPAKSIQHLQTARRIWNSELHHKERYRIMIDSSEAYSACLEMNSPISRARLRSIAAEASEKGYLFQTCSALLCLASCCLAAEEWREAKPILLRALDLTTTLENLKSRIFAFHYLSICAHMMGSNTETRDWALQARNGLLDPGLAETQLGLCLRNNYDVINENAPSSDLGFRHAGLLCWQPWNRA